MSTAKNEIKWIGVRFITGWNAVTYCYWSVHLAEYELSAWQNVDV